MELKETLEIISSPSVSQIRRVWGCREQGLQQGRSGGRNPAAGPGPQSRALSTQCPDRVSNSQDQTQPRCLPGANTVLEKLENEILLNIASVKIIDILHI